MIIKRYLRHNLWQHFFLVLCCLVIIALSNVLLTLLKNAPNSYLPLKVIGLGLIYSLPDLLCFMLPLSYYLGILIASARLLASNELTIARSIGLSPLTLLKIVIKPALVLMLINAACSLYLAPKCLNLREQVMVQNARQHVTRTLQAQRFVSFNQGQQVVFFENFANKKTVEDVFMVEHSKLTKNDLVIVKAKQLEFEASKNTLSLNLKEGFVHALPVNKSYQSIKFSSLKRSMTQLLQPILPKNKLATDTWSDISIKLLWPLSTIVLSLYAILMINFQPRQGQFVYYTYAGLFYIAYTILLLALRRGNYPLIAYGINLIAVILILILLPYKFKLKSNDYSN